MWSVVWTSSVLIFSAKSQLIIPKSSQQTATCDTGGECVLQCEGNNLCQSMLIDASNANTFSLNCSGIQSCDSAQIQSPISGTIDIMCDKSSADSAAEGACTSLQVFGASAKNITVQCMQTRDCVALNISISSLEASNIHFNGEESGVGAYINGRDSSDSFRVFCNGYHACTSAQILCPRSEHSIDCHVECDVAGACEDMSYFREASPSFKSVICPDLSLCYIACNGTDQCRASQFYGRYANVMTVSCTGDDSCAGTTIYSPNHALHIECIGDAADVGSSSTGACHWLTINGEHTATNEVRVECRHNYDCFGLSFHTVSTRVLYFMFGGERSGDAAIINAMNVTDNVTIVCNGSEACFDTDLYCPSNAGNSATAKCLVDCVGTSSCAKMRFFIPNAAYDRLELQCSEHNGSNCFTLNEANLPLSYDADLYCLDTFARSELIYNRWNGQLYCREACCPFVVEEIDCTFDECVVDCAYTYCDGRTINGANKALLNVVCGDDQECNELTVICPSNGECNIVCSTPNGCQSLTVHHLAETNANQAHISLLCEAQSQCDGVIMNVSYANLVQIEARNIHSLSNAYIYAEHVAVLQLVCDSTAYYYAVSTSSAIAEIAACVDNHLFVGDVSSDDDDSIHVYCTGHSCAVNTIYVEDGWTALADNLDFVVDSNCGQCGGVGWSSCIGGVNLVCGAALDTTQSLMDGVCSADASECGCEILRADIDANYVEELEGCVSQIDTTAGAGNGDEEGAGVGGGVVAGVVLAMFCAIAGGLALWYWCWYKKQQRELHELNIEDESGDEAAAGTDNDGTSKRKRSHHKQQSTLDISITDAVCPDVLPENLMDSIQENEDDNDEQEELQEPEITAN
eukprot:CAMPEP_0202693284 /NCGR_PEP_ID=MMETSP1385-20130828/7440_1 /ASSEMBLY_ACC=CAM_ASM_000861 /TAXON_ID=933848 /ORGANISM="Elphidium margaritaceum" /LENGTH=860 /DNA_ID=CAMNT_0049348943 /DNA_START=34 /DNA_END=2616 /DNA_ORIENTATION=+